MRDPKPRNLSKKDLGLDTRLPAKHEPNQRHLKVIQYAQEELRAYRAGEIDKLSTGKELAERFGYADHTSIYGILKIAGISEERKPFVEEKRSELAILAQSRRKKESQEIPTSYESAWVLGILAGGAFIGEGLCVMNLGDRHKHRAFVEKFVPIGERFFRTKAKQQTKTRPHATDTIGFYNQSIVLALGDLRRDYWPETIRTKHSWILQNPQYSWAFLEGLFEIRGVISKGILSKNQRMDLGYHTTSISNAVFIMELLGQLGIEKSYIDHNKQASQNIDGISIRNFPDLQRFASNVHSIMPEREELLQAYRDLDVTKKKGLRYEDEELLTEWRRISNEELTGNEPREADIINLRKLQRTKYSASTYSLRFGRGNFSTAKENIRRILAEQEDHLEQPVGVLLLNEYNLALQEALQRGETLSFEDFIRSKQ